MKPLNKEQINLLVDTIAEQIEAEQSKSSRATKKEKAAIRTLVSRHRILQNKAKVAEDAFRAHEAKIKNFLGTPNTYYAGGTTIDNLTKIVEKRNTPNRTDIRRAIITATLFGTPEDLKKEVNKWVKRFTPAPRKERVLVD